MRRASNRREGIATSEMAICLPILILLTLATLETCTVIFLKETITIGAYEGARVGIRKQGTDAQVAAKVASFLESRGISFDSDFIEMSSPGFDNAADLENITVTVNVPCDGNTYSGWIFTGRNVSASVTMRKEFSNL